MAPCPKANPLLRKPPHGTFWLRYSELDGGVCHNTGYNLKFRSNFVHDGQPSGKVLPMRCYNKLSLTLPQSSCILEDDK